MIAEHRQILALPAQRCIEKRRDVHLSELALIGLRNETARIERPRAARSTVETTPRRVPLTVIGPVHEYRRLEPGLAIGEADPLVLRQAVERRHVAVVRPVNQEVVVVRDRRRLVGGAVLPVYRRNRHE